MWAMIRYCRGRNRIGVSRVYRMAQGEASFLKDTMQRFIECAGIVGLWMFLSWLPIRICDYDFREGLPSSQWETALNRYYAVSAFEAVSFALLFITVDRTAQKRWLIGLALGELLTCLAVFGYQWLDFPHEKWPIEYKLFLISAFVQKAFRVFLSVYLYLFAAYCVWNAVRRIQRWGTSHAPDEK